MTWRECLRSIRKSLSIVLTIPPARLFAEGDPREGFADWLVAPENPLLARAKVNRVWSWLLGREIIHSPTRRA